MSTYLDVNFRAGRRAPFEERLPITLQGLGESQAYYDRITADQDALTVRLAEITAADQSAWDGIWDTLQGKYIPNTSTWFTGWGYTKQLILDTWNTLAPTKSPGESEFANAEKLLADTAQMVAYFKQIVPEQTAKIEQESASTKQEVASVTPLRSPEEVGMDTFKQILQERANAMVSWGGNTIAIAAGAALALLLLARR